MRLHTQLKKRKSLRLRTELAPGPVCGRLQPPPDGSCSGHGAWRSVLSHLSILWPWPWPGRHERVGYLFELYWRPAENVNHLARKEENREMASGRPSCFCAGPGSGPHTSAAPGRSRKLSSGASRAWVCPRPAPPPPRSPAPQRLLKLLSSH